MEGFIGEIRLFAPNFAPKNWAFCNGQILAININQALFAILGTTYGGNGSTTFALPDLRGRSAIGAGAGPGLSNYILGQQTGSPSTVLLANQLPQHTHSITGTISMLTTNNAAVNEMPNNNYFANDGSTRFGGQHDNVTMKPINVNLLANAGGSSAINNMMPYQGVNYIICLTGIFPSRN
ncbi:phage tail protein [Niastella sp. OAS944]|uniref:phage tail protein n=1 Tax=Niastella sp. OAS944 TaxID=2664089 RepID=UPI00349A6044|nr:microcystin-dependent protein [Chitinophagaceae bacterium OAS944]